MDDNGEEIKATLKSFIKNNFLYSSDTVMEDDTSFLDTGIIDSTGVLELIDFIEENFGISIDNNEVIPENLDSINKIEKFILSKKN